MKKVFMGISVLAIIYLGLQSGLAKHISLPNWHAVVNQTQNQNDNAAAVELALKEELQEALRAMHAENNALRERLASLEAKIESTQLDSHVANHPQVKSTDTNQTIDIAQTPLSTNVSSGMPITNEADTASDKRLQQQAILRSVAHTMELAALSSLSK